MFFALPVWRTVSRYLRFICLGIFLFAAAIAFSKIHRRPKPWQIDEVPVTFWAWRTQTPAEGDVRQAVINNQARAIFLHAGQIDYQNGKPVRIRPVTGSLPNQVDLHFVYNATRHLLAQLDNIDEKALANEIAKVFQEDCQRAVPGHAHVAGIQIDIDVPTRLLGRYERILRELRPQLPPEMKLSITGLPTWMQSSQLRSTLTQVDFWTPQIYGADLPARVDQLIPIATPQDVERFVNHARALGKPFYAGLAAYSWALLYDSSGTLISVRGNLDPSVVSQDTNLELIDQRPFDSSHEWRYAYRARTDGVTDGVAMHAGDVLVLDIQSAESLRQSARIVREWAGEKLLGICVFRLPSADDPATLNSNQVAAALVDRDSSAEIKINFHPKKSGDQTWILEVENAGTASAVGGLRVDVHIDAGTIESIDAEAGESALPICQTIINPNTPIFERCSERRANTISIDAAGLRVGQVLKTTVVFRSSPPQTLSCSIETQSDTGNRYSDRKQVELKTE